MTFEKELLLSPQGIETFLQENKSNLRDIATDINVGYSTLKNYAYNQTPIDSMPYRLLKALTDYLEPSDLLHPTTFLMLEPTAFYSLLTLARPELNKIDLFLPESYSIMEYTKALLLFLERDKQASDDVIQFEPRYFFVDFKYKNQFLTMDVNITPRQKFVYQSVDQLKSVYGLSQDKLDNLIQKDKDQVYLSSTDSDIFKDLLIKFPSYAIDEYLVQILKGAYNIHLITTNLTHDPILTHMEQLVSYKTLETQSKYIFENNQWFTETGRSLSSEDLSHLNVTEWQRLHQPTNVIVYKSLLRNLINNFNTTVEHPWDSIFKYSLQSVIKNMTSVSNLPTDAHIYENNILYAALMQNNQMQKTFENLAKNFTQQINQKITQLKKES